MENKKLAMIVALANIFLLIFLAGYPVLREKIDQSKQKEFFLKQDEYSKEVKGIEEEQGNELTEANRRQNVIIRSQKLPEILLTLEGEAGEFKVSMWQNGDGTCYFFLPGFARGKGLILDSAEGGSIYIGNTEIKEGDILRDISEERIYELSVPGDGSAEGLNARLIFLYSSELPVLSLSTNSGSMEFIEAEKGNEEAGNAALYDRNGDSIYVGQVESIKGRGNSTWGLSKKPFQIKLCEDVDFFGFGKARSWNLLANGYDETRLRNQIALELASELGMRYVPEGRMIDLYINDRYWGNYFLTEKVRVAICWKESLTLVLGQKSVVL